MQANEVMTRPVITCPIDSHLDHAAQLMWDHDCGAIPVVDADGRLAGIVTDRDVCMAAYTQGVPLTAIPVASAMATHVLVCQQSDPVALAEELMRDGQVRRVPVVDSDGHPVGIVSMNDLARLAGQARKGVVDREVVQTLAAVCAPRALTDRPVDQIARPIAS